MVTPAAVYNFTITVTKVAHQSIRLSVGRLSEDQDIREKNLIIWYPDNLPTDMLIF
jgi:hypothetical protein